MFDYIPPDPKSEETTELGFGTLAIASVAGILMWLGFVRIIEFVLENAPW